MTALRRTLCLALLAVAAGALLPLATATSASEEELAGTLMIVHTDDTNGGATFDYKLQRGNVLHDVQIDRRRAQELLGRTVRLRGHRDVEGSFVVGAGSGSAQPTGGTVAAVSGSKRVAVLLFNFSNDRSTPWTQQTVRGVFFDNPSSVSAYYTQASDGKIGLTGDVFGFYELAAANTGCNWSSWATEARTAATAAGVDLTSYNYVVYAFPYVSSCGWAGLGYLPGSGAWLNGSLTLRVAGHELGHNLGVHHASSLSCTSGATRVSYSATCSASEYGDPFTIMGAASTYLSHNWHRAQHGWATDTVTVSTSGTFTLRPSEGTMTPRALRIARGDGTYYWLEFRQPSTPFDTFSATSPAVTGVTVRLVPDSTSIVQSKLLDMTPGTTSFSDAPLAVGKSYTDAGLGVTITTASVSATGASVAVSFGGSGGGGTGGGGTGGGGTGGGSGGGSTDTQPPTAPPGLTATVLSSTSVRLSWFASTDNRGVTQYEVSRDGTVLTTLPATTRLFTDSALSPSTAYSYSVVALDAAGNRSLASTRTATTRPAPDTTAPTAPTELTGSTFSGYQVSLRWQAATDNVGVTGYRVYRNGVQIRQLTTLAHTDRPYRTGTYTYTVKAVDAAGNLSAASNAVQVRVGR